MKKFIDNLKKQAQENPAAAIIVGAIAVTAAAKLMQASTEKSNSRAWAKEVDRRVKNSR